MIRYSDSPIIGAGICEKSKEVSDDPLAGDGISGYGKSLQTNHHLKDFRRETPKI